MPRLQIFQIYYSDRTRAELDPGFVPLDNSSNERPDWREYWPMRKALLEQRLDPDTHYGFFSPKFRTKTGLEAAAVAEFVARNESADVITFSPFFDQIALPLNVIEQATGTHEDCRGTFNHCAELVTPRFQTDRCVMSSLNTVFCNFFVARPAFWAEWLGKCETIFELAEQSLTPLARDLNRVVSYGALSAPAKVFVIERVVSLLLWSQARWSVKAFDAVRLPLSSPFNIPELIVLDALKIAYSQSGAEHFLGMHQQLRARMLGRLAPTERVAVASEPRASASGT